MKILITGMAGFIGHHLARRLLRDGHDVTGIDSMNDYYAVGLKTGRLADLGIDGAECLGEQACTSRDNPSLKFVRMRLEDRQKLPQLFAEGGFDAVVNLAAQAGVRYSLENLFAYVDSNVSGFVNLLECCRHNPVGHLIYASSSSVYGDNAKVPFAEDDAVDNPVSLYAATKRSDELMAQVYARLFGVASTGLRFFTVYGPWGRPDMSPMLFSDAITSGRPIRLFNNGDMLRDFTYIDDIVEGIVRLLDKAPQGELPTDIFNIGHGDPVRLMDFIATLEEALGRKAVFERLPMQAGDVPRTYADTSKLHAKTGYTASTPLREGIGRFVEWYLSDSNPLKSRAAGHER